MPWPKLFPNASKKAINLLSRMLVLHPKERLTVEQALVHPYLNKYHDPDDEPICVPAFNFDFEKEVRFGMQGIFCPSLWAEFRPHSQSKIATFFPIPCLFFPN